MHLRRSDKFKSIALGVMIAASMSLSVYASEMEPVEGQGKVTESIINIDSTEEDNTLNNEENAGNTESYLDMGTFSLTAYCPCRLCNDRWTGYPTAYGTPLTVGQTVAVDRRVIPLGSWIDIEVPGEGWKRFRAEDTGGAVKGKHIDVCVPSHGDTYQSRYNTNGAETVRVRIVN